MSPAPFPPAPFPLVTADAAMRARLTKGEAAHKYSYGHALVLAGGPGKGGAARLAARAALRVGAGLVTLLPPPEALAENAAQLNAVMLTALPDDAGALQDLLAADARITALLIGPAAGRPRAFALVPAVLAARRATVLDADALTAFTDAPETLFSLLHPGVVLTPHAGEFARLFPDLGADLPLEPAPRGARLAQAAARAGCTILLKGAETLIATQDGTVLCHRATGPEAAPWLATAGSGDVLAGLITGLLARGGPPVQAAAAGAWLHAAAARRFGPGLIAEDLPEQIPAVFRDLGL